MDRHITRRLKAFNDSALYLSKEERVARCRGYIEACRAVEMTFPADSTELPIVLNLAQARMEAAKAKQELLFLIGEEP